MTLLRYEVILETATISGGESMSSRKVMRVERHIQVHSVVCESWCRKAGLLYNYCNYQLRQSFFATGNLPDKYELIRQLTVENQPDYRALPAQTAQQTILKLYTNWKAFLAACKVYKTNPEGFLGRPKPPKYKHDKKQSVLVFTNQQCKIRDGYVHFPKMVGFEPVKTAVTSDQLREVRISPQATCHVIEAVYEKVIDVTALPEENVLAIDLGLDNLATCVNNVGEQPFIVSGKPLKALNQFYNKRKATLQRYIGMGTSKRIQRLTFKRNQRVQDYLHKTSRIIVNYCIAHHIGLIVIGKNPQWKQGVRLGKRTNQQFVNVPFATLIHMVAYKAEIVGMKVVCHEESYTSKCDHLAFEPMKHQETYRGKRVTRGLFQSSVGRLLSADVNGAIGIGRKVVGDDFIWSLLNSGGVLTPVKIQLLTKGL